MRLCNGCGRFCTASQDPCPNCGTPVQTDLSDNYTTNTSQQPTHFENPSNGYRESIEGAWLWTLLFGCFYFAYRKVWSHALISAVLAVMTLGISWLVYPFFARNILTKYYLREGWHPVDG